MKRILLSAALLAGMSVSTMASAAPGKWHCFSENKRGMRWHHAAVNRHAAIRWVRQACRASGSRHCFAGPDQCNFKFRALWVCVVRDVHGRTWRAQDVNQGAACHIAKRECRHWHNSRGRVNYQCNVANAFPK